MKRSLIAVILFLAFSWNSLAQQTDADAPATKEDVQRYWTSCIPTHDEANDRSYVEAPAQDAARGLSEEQGQAPSRFRSTNEPNDGRYAEEHPFDEMMQAMVPTYQKHFTKGELNALVVFYGSPTGQKILHEMPAISVEAMESMMPIMRRNIGRITQTVQQETAEILKESDRKGARTRQ